MAIAAFVTQLQALGQTTTTNTRVFTIPAGGVAAGQTLIICVKRDAGGSASGSISDSKGNTWTVETHDFGTIRFHTVFRAYITNAMVAGDTITIVWPFAFVNFAGNLLQYTNVKNQAQLSSGFVQGSTPAVSVTTSSAPTYTADFLWDSAIAFWLASVLVLAGDSGSTLVFGAVGAADAFPAANISAGAGFAKDGILVNSGSGTGPVLSQAESRTVTVGRAWAQVI